MTPQQKYGRKIYNRIYGDDEESERVEKQRKRIRQAVIPKSPKEFMAEGMFYGVVAGLGGWIFTMLFVYLLIFLGVIPTELGLLQIQNDTLLRVVNLLKVPVAVLGSGVVLGLVGFVVTYYGYLFYPSLIANGRSREMGMLMSDAVSYMYALSVGGMNELQIFKAVAEAEDTYGEIAVEFQILTKETDYFDTDYRSAIQKRSQETPNTNLGIFFSDMLSILSSGGNMQDFLSEQRRKYLREAKQEEEDTLETLELFGEMFMTLSLFPLLLIIVIVAMSIGGQANVSLLYGATYGLIPGIGVGFLVLIATFKQDELGEGVLVEPDVNIRGKHPLEAADLVDRAEDSTDEEYPFFDTARKKEYLTQAKYILKKPHLFFKDYPAYTLLVSIPLAILVLILGIVLGLAPLSIDGLIENTVGGTFFLVLLPLYVIGIPLSFFHEWNEWDTGKIVSNLSGTIRKIGNANDTGMTLLESIREVGRSSNDRFANELETVYRKTQSDYSLKEALVELNNDYKIPRLARTLKILVKSQEASQDMSDVLKTVAELSETQDDIVRERKSRARMQVAIIIMTFVTLLGVMVILQTQFIEVMTGLTESASSGSGGGGGGGSSSGAASQFEINLDPSELSMIFYHAVVLQAFFSGITSGYIRDASVISGLKYSIILSFIANITWLVITL